MVDNTQGISATEQKDIQLDKALKDLEIDNKEFTSRKEITIAKETDLTNRVTQINKIALSYRMILEGKTFFEETGSFKQTGPAIAGKKFISLSYGVINSYSNESNLITEKDFDKFAIQFMDAFEKVNNLILRDRSISEKDYRVIIKLFKDKLMNIGDIITGASGNMEKIFNTYKEENTPSDLGKLGKGY